MALGWRGQYLRYKEIFLNVLALYKKRADLRMFLEIILSLFTITMFSLFALKPTALTIISLVKEVNGKKSLVAKLDSKISNLQKARNTFSQEQSNISIIDSSIPNSPSPDVLVRQIQGLANKDSVSILGISVGEATLVGTDSLKKKSSDKSELPLGANEMPISVSFTGAFANLNSMIKDLENLRLPLKIDVLGVNSTNLETGQTIVVSVSGRVPYLK